MKLLKISKLFLFTSVLSLSLNSCSETEETTTVNQKNVTEETAAPEMMGKITSIFGNGVNIQPSYYNGGNVKLGFSILDNYKSKVKTVRIEIDPRRVTVTTAKKWIQDAQNAGFRVIATYHRGDQLGSNDPTHLYAAAYWWKNNYAALGGDFYINLMNEWGGHTLGANTYRNAYNNAMNVIRQIPSYQSKPIIIDIAGWAQDVAKAASIANQLEQGESNFIFSIHAYSDAYNEGVGMLNASHFQALYNAHPQCMVGEFGFRSLNRYNGSEYGVNQMVAQAKSYGWPVLGWAWVGCGDGYDDMNMIRSNLSGSNFPLVHISNNSQNPYSISNTYFNSIYSSL